MTEGFRAHPAHPVLLYNLACYESLTGRPQDALEHLREAVECDRQYARFAAQDNGLDAIRGEAGFPAPSA